MLSRRPHASLAPFVSRVWAASFGHRWNVGHEIEEVSPSEMQRRFDEMVKGG